MQIQCILQFCLTIETEMDEWEEKSTKKTPAMAAIPKSAKETPAQAATENDNDLSFELKPEPIPSHSSIREAVYSFELDQDLKPLCGYGKTCSQENPLHLRIYRHPKDNEGTEDADKIDVRKDFEISKEDPKYMMCTICGSMLSKSSKEAIFQKHLETKKHLKKLNLKNRLKLKAIPKSIQETPANAATLKSAKKTPAKAATSKKTPAKAATSGKTPAKAATSEKTPAKAATSEKTPTKAATSEKTGIFAKFFSMF